MLNEVKNPFTKRDNSIMMVLCKDKRGGSKHEVSILRRRKYESH